MKKISFFDKFKKYLSPQENAGAFEVNDKTIKCFYFEPNTYKIEHYDIEQLKPGTIIKGEIKDAKEFEKTLLKIKNKRKAFFKNSPYMILSLPSENFFTTVLEIPKETLNFSKLEDTIKLNLENVTPIPIDEGYLDWETIEKEDSDNLAIFTGIGKKSSIDVYLSCFYKNGFKVLAVEKPALGLSRFVLNYSNIKEPYLLINIDRDGIDFMLADQKKILFYDFDPWSEITQLNVQQFLNTQELSHYYTRKINQILSYHNNKSNTEIRYFYFFSLVPNIKQYSVSFIQNTFKLLFVQNNLPLNIKNLSEEWNGIIGTAFRGLIPRSKDTIISMMEIGTEKEYQQSKLFQYIYMWCRFLCILFGALALIFYLLNIFVFQKLNKPQLISQTSQHTKLSQSKQVLEEQLDLFNYYVPRLIKVYTEQPKYNEFFSDIYLLATQNNVEILEMYYGGNITNITIQAKSKSKKYVTNFKDDLNNIDNFTYISSPVESVSNENGNYFFTIKVSYSEADRNKKEVINTTTTTIYNTTTTKNEKESTILTLPK